MSEIIKRAQVEGNDLDDHINFLCFTKPYKGKLYRGGKYQDKQITFYDEREWRYIPQLNLSLDHTPNYLFKEEFLDKTKLIEMNLKLENKKLSFDPKDIKYIIVEKEAEIYDMASSIRRIKAKFSHRDVETLVTRIISMEHIREDF